MFVLYGYENGMIKSIGSSFNEGSIIKMIQNRIDTNYIHFIIIKKLEDMDIPYRCIMSEEEFIEYADEYSERIMKDCSAIELKRKILNRSKKC